MELICYRHVKTEIDATAMSHILHTLVHCI